MKVAIVIAVSVLAAGVAHAERYYADADAEVRAHIHQRECEDAKPVAETGDDHFDVCALLQAFLRAKTPKLKDLVDVAYLGRAVASSVGAHFFGYATLVITAFAPPPVDDSESVRVIDDGVAPSVPKSSLTTFAVHLGELPADINDEKAAIQAHLEAVRSGKKPPKSSVASYLDDLVAGRWSRRLARTTGKSLVYFHGSTAVFLRQAGTRLIFVEVDTRQRGRVPTRLHAGELFVPAQR